RDHEREATQREEFATTQTHVGVLPVELPTVRRSYSRTRAGQENAGARELAALEELERPVRFPQRERRRRRADRDSRRLGEQLLTVGARVRRDAPDRALVEEVAVRSEEHTSELH